MFVHSVVRFRPNVSVSIFGRNCKNVKILFRRSGSALWTSPKDFCDFFLMAKLGKVQILDEGTFLDRVISPLTFFPFFVITLYQQQHCNYLYNLCTTSSFTSLLATTLVYRLIGRRKSYIWERGYYTSTWSIQINQHLPCHLPQPTNLGKVA